MVLDPYEKGFGAVSYTVASGIVDNMYSYT